MDGLGPRDFKVLGLRFSGLGGGVTFYFVLFHFSFWGGFQTNLVTHIHTYLPIHTYKMFTTVGSLLGRATASRAKLLCSSAKRPADTGLVSQCSLP